MKKRATVLVFALGLAICFAGCGDKKDDPSASGGGEQTTTEAVTETAKGTTESWGVYSEIFVPDGMKLTGGSQIDKEDQNTVWVQDSRNQLNYYVFGISTSEDQCKKDVESTREFNKDSDPQDISIRYGDNEWKGVTYKYNGTTDVVQMYSVIGGKAVTVRIGGYAYDAASTKQILESLKIK